MPFITVRRAHVKRIKGKNSDGSDAPDVWLDMYRVDEFAATNNPGGQGEIYHLRWGDDPNGDNGGVGNPGRQVTTIKVVGPDEVDLENPSVYVPVNAVDRFAKAFDSDQALLFHYKNRKPGDEKAVNRDVTVKRVTHFDTNHDDDTDLYVSWDDYKRIEGTEDDSQFVDEEVINRYRVVDPEQLYQATIYNVPNGWLKDFLRSPTSDALHAVRLDPFQSIVNMKWESPEIPFVIIAGTRDATGGSQVAWLRLVKGVPIIDQAMNPSPFGDGEDLPICFNLGGGFTFTTAPWGAFFSNESCFASVAAVSRGGCGVAGVAEAPDFGGNFTLLVLMPGDAGETIDPCGNLAPSFPAFVRSISYDEEGNQIATPPPPARAKDPRGIRVGIVIVNSSTVTRYNGNAVVWSRDLSPVLVRAVTVGGMSRLKVVYGGQTITLDPETGTTLSDNTFIDFESLPPGSFLDVASDGSTFYIEGGTNTIRKYSIDGNLEWTVTPSQGNVGGGGCLGENLILFASTQIAPGVINQFTYDFVTFECVIEYRGQDAQCSAAQVNSGVADCNAISQTTDVHEWGWIDKNGNMTWHSAGVTSNDNCNSGWNSGARKAYLPSP